MEILGFLAEPWADQALCAQTDPEMFFPDKGGTPAPAKRVCMACPVRSECLEFALANEVRHGVWGGLSERERRKVNKRRVAAVAVVETDDETVGAA